MIAPATFGALVMETARLAAAADLHELATVTLVYKLSLNARALACHGRREYGMATFLAQAAEVASEVASELEAQALFLGSAGRAEA